MSAVALAIALAVASAQNGGVELVVHQDDECIWISEIERIDGPPGAGADAIRHLMEIADEHGVPLRGAVVRDHEALLAYYESLGFELAQDNVEAGVRRLMIEYTP